MLLGQEWAFSILEQTISKIKSQLTMMRLDYCHQQNSYQFLLSVFSSEFYSAETLQISIEKAFRQRQQNF